MVSELVLLEINIEVFDFKQTDVSAECANKGGEIYIFDSEITINNYTFYLN